MNDLVKRLRQGCDCSEKVCEMDTFSELAADRIEELEAENRIFRATESVDDTVWDALLEQIRSHQSRIEAGLKLEQEWSAGVIGSNEAMTRLREALSDG